MTLAQRKDMKLDSFYQHRDNSFSCILLATLTQTPGGSFLKCQDYQAIWPAPPPLNNTIVSIRSIMLPRDSLLLG